MFANVFQGIIIKLSVMSQDNQTEPKHNQNDQENEKKVKVLKK